MTFEFVSAELGGMDLFNQDPLATNPFIGNYAAYCRTCEIYCRMCETKCNFRRMILNGVIQSPMLKAAEDNLFRAYQRLVIAQKMYARALFNPARPDLVIPFSPYGGYSNQIDDDSDDMPIINSSFSSDEESDDENNISLSQ
jgi:hypothetical protein